MIIVTPEMMLSCLDFRGTFQTHKKYQIYTYTPRDNDPGGGRIPGYNPLKKKSLELQGLFIKIPKRP